MGEEVELREFVSERTKQYKIGELTIQSPKIQDQLFQIEEYLQSLILAQKEMAIRIKEISKININSVSAGAKVPRSTIYNNNRTLQVYIEKRCKEIEDQDILQLKRFNKVKANDKAIQIIIDGLQLQIVDNYELKQQIKEGERQLKSQIGQLEDKQKEIFALQKQINELQKRQSGSTVIPINTNTNKVASRSQKRNPKEITAVKKDNE
ncbi:hypothetical protein [Pelosinus propionicus]|uniref:Uncharacterized protein n=1 Tax=Pelosinus propionicus DSM 13327 TaxID=1123291 RepID=A0A1I4JVC8_9FIRM|nr:hypothetical protein [Pelosinus propionicus]SFL70291.1 hypothetical protein SAMN04490355_101437 [Pelosinus propionicus DSM 13327]